MKIRQIKPIFCIGIGYWKNTYTGEYGQTGHCHSILLPFCIIRFGVINVKQANK